MKAHLDSISDHRIPLFETSRFDDGSDAMLKKNTAITMVVYLEKGRRYLLNVTILVSKCESSLFSV